MARVSAIDYLGNISMRLVGLLVTVGTLAAIYFFVIKPIGDTTGDAFDSIAPAFESIGEAQRQAAEAQEAAQQQAKKSGDPQSQKQANDLSKCLNKAGSNINKIEVCLTK